MLRVVAVFMFLNVAAAVAQEADGLADAMEACAKHYVPTVGWQLGWEKCAQVLELWRARALERQKEVETEKEKRAKSFLDQLDK